MKNMISTSLAVLFVLIAFVIGAIAAFFFQSNTEESAEVSNPGQTTAPDGSAFQEPTSPPTLDASGDPSEQSQGPSYPPPSN